MSTLEELTNSKDQIKDSFNKFMVTIFNHIGNKYHDSYFYEYRETINKFFVERPYEPIANFITYIYSNDEYRENIKKGDDSFFLSQSYDTVANNDSDSTLKIFQFKDLWVKMDESNKKIVKQTFITLINRTEMYIEVLSQINQLKKNKN